MSTAAAAPLTPKPATARETIVEFKDVWKRYGNKEILAGVNLTISRGEVLCVLGPSGTGKSVTIRHINGLTQPDEGDVFVFGNSVVGLSEEQLTPVRQRTAMFSGRGAVRLDECRAEHRVPGGAHRQAARRGRADRRGEARWSVCRAFRRR